MVTKGGRRDTVIGAIVVLVGALLLGIAYASGGRSDTKDGGYSLTARFNRADGISVGSPVRLSGMIVGRVSDQRLDERYRAVLTLQLVPNVALTDDTAAVIYTDGLLGSKFVELKPGADEQVLKPGEEIRYTQDAVVVEDLLDMIIQQARAKRGYLDKPLPSTSN
jgi:phospholipid/cholesterol/gamma-HCH transport system substrate-binding protein